MDNLPDDFPYRSSYGVHKKFEIPSYLGPFSSLGCLSSLVGLGSLVVGIYHGIAHKKGMPVGSELELLLDYGPSALAGIIGMTAASRMNKDPFFQEKLPPVPLEAEGCRSGCGIISGAVGGAAGAGVLNLLGYYIGSWLGSQF